MSFLLIGWSFLKKGSEMLKAYDIVENNDRNKSGALMDGSICRSMCCAFWHGFYGVSKRMTGADSYSLFGFELRYRR